MSLLQSLTIQNWFEIGTGTLILIPSYLFFKYYRRSGILEFLFFGIMGVLITINEFTLVIRDLTSLSVLSEQIIDTTMYLISFILCLHVMRVKWEKPPKSILFLTIIWFTVLQLMVLFYKIITVPEKGFYLFMEMNRLGTSDIGAGIIIGNNIIHANGYIFLEYIFSFYISSLFLYVYLTTKPITNDKRVNIARKLWIFGDCFVVAFSILALGHLIGLWTIQLFKATLTMFIGIAIVFFIALRYPEALLFSQAKVLTCMNLYDKFASFKTEHEVREFGMSSLVKYIKSLPTELFDEIDTSS